MAPRQAIEPESWAREVDQSKVQASTNSNFFVWCGIAAIAVVVGLIIWALVT